MKVSSIMTSPVITVKGDAGVQAVARIFVDNSVSGVPVVDDAGRVAGIITKSDLIVRNANLHFPRFLQILDARIFLENPSHFEEETRRMLGSTATEVMTSPVVVVGPDDDVEKAATLMMEKKVHCLPVVQDGRLVGIVCEYDIVRLIANGDEDAS